jgi:hypothetical protein
VIQHHGKFEIRYYAERLVIETLMRDENDSSAFRTLLHYLSGKNSTHKKIAMTIPVEVRPNDRCEVGTESTDTLLKNGSGMIMRLTLPNKMKESEMPQPLSKKVNAYASDERVLATLRFSGSWSMERCEEQGKALLTELARTEYRPIGPVMGLSYDPPFTIPCFRRNEVAVEVNRVSNV